MDLLLPCPSGVDFPFIVTRLFLRTSMSSLLSLVYLALLVLLEFVDESRCGVERGLLSPGLTKVLKNVNNCDL